MIVRLALLRLGLCGLCSVLGAALCGCGNLPGPYSPPTQRPFFEGPPETARVLNMDDADAESHFVRDISTLLEANAWRWTAKRPTIRLRVSSNQNLAYFIDFTIGAEALQHTGPVTLSFFVNNHLLEKIRYTTPGRRSFEKPVPAAWVDPNDNVILAAEIDKLWMPPAGRQAAGVHPGSAGFGTEMKAIAALAGGAFTVAASYALGSVIAARLGAPLRRSEKFPLAFVLGAAVLHLAVFAVLALKIAYKPVLWLLLAVCVALALRTGAWRLPAAESPSPKRPLPYGVGYLFSLIAMPFTVLYLFNAWAPEISPDGSSYHLGLIARYLRAHGFERITTDMLASFSEGVEMVYLPAFAIGRHSAAALVHFAFLIALGLAIFAYGKRIGKPLAGAGAALLVYLSPVVGVDGTTAYTDVAVAAIVFSVFYWTQIWDENRDNRILIAIGLLTGYCYAAKYTAFVMIIYTAGFVAWRTRKWRPVRHAGRMLAHYGRAVGYQGLDLSAQPRGSLREPVVSESLSSCLDRKELGSGCAQLRPPESVGTAA